MIQQISNTEFRLSARGSDMTLVNNNGIWEMYVVNAAVKAYRRGIASPKRFPHWLKLKKNIIAGLEYQLWQTKRICNEL